MSLSGTRRPGEPLLNSSISGVKPTSAGAAQNGADDPFRTYPPVDTLTQ